DEDPWYVSLGNTAKERAQVYAAWLETAVSGKEWEQIRTATQQGRVVGSDSFQEEVGSTVGRRLKGETRGRPKRVDRSEIPL
ncbi:MAG: transposase, partial [Nitrospiraceae bacterium]